MSQDGGGEASSRERERSEVESRVLERGGLDQPLQERERHTHTEGSGVACSTTMRTRTRARKERFEKVFYYRIIQKDQSV